MITKVLPIVLNIECGAVNQIGSLFPIFSTHVSFGVCSFTLNKPHADHIEVYISKSNRISHATLIFKWHMVGVNLRMDTQKPHVEKKFSTSSKYVIFSRCKKININGGAYMVIL